MEELTSTEKRRLALEKARAVRAAKKAVSDEATAAEEANIVIDGNTSDAVVDREVKKDAQNMAEALMKDEMVHFMIPYDPSLPRDAQFWENSLNGHILRFPRGVELCQPKYIADYVNKKIEIEKKMRYGTSEFRSGMGKHLKGLYSSKIKSGDVYEAILHIANTANGEKILYDIDLNIKKGQRRLVNQPQQLPRQSRRPVNRPQQLLSVRAYHRDRAMAIPRTEIICPPIGVPFPRPWTTTFRSTDASPRCASASA